MKLVEINKKQYRKRLNLVIIGFIVGFAILAIGCGSAFIAMFAQSSDSLVEPAPSNFKYNLAGVIIALVLCMATLHRLREKVFFTEIYYVWQLKQVQNQILRKLKIIKKQAYDNSDVNACIVLSFYYASLKQLYWLDDNTITLSEVNRDECKLTGFIAENAIAASADMFDKTLLEAFK